MFRWWLENLNVQNIFKMNGVLFVIVQGDFTFLKKNKTISESFCHKEIVILVKVLTGVNFKVGK